MTGSLKNYGKSGLLLLVDITAFYCSLFFAYYTRVLLEIVHPQLIPLQFSLTYFLHIWWLPVIYLAFITYERLYVRKLPFWDETRELLKATSVSLVAILAIISLGRLSGNISRLTVILLWFYGLFFFPLFRLIGKNILYAAGLWRENVIIIGAGSAGVETAKGISGDIHLGYHVIGFLDDNEQIGRQVRVNGTSYKIFGRIRHFKKFVKILNISTVIIAIPSLSVDKLSELTNEIQRYTKSVLLVPDVKGVALTNTELYHLFMQQLFLLKINNNLKSPVNRFLKRTFDLAVSILLLPLLLPLIGVLGLLIKFDSPGPIFYRHTRVGREGLSFCMYKFRTMYRDSQERMETILSCDDAARQEWESCFKLKNDPRITKIGSFLRRVSLDELPQIFNVLKGEMSLVGPRPVIRTEIDRYYKEYTDYYQLVRPGLTGLWQVSGRNNIGYDNRVKLDSWYVLNWALWLDVVILFRTIKVVFKEEGAY